MGLAQSSFYPRGPKPSHIPEPTWEWYSPTKAELVAMSEETLKHVKNGGLLLRERTKREPIYHDESQGALR